MNSKSKFDRLYEKLIQEQIHLDRLYGTPHAEECSTRGGFGIEEELCSLMTDEEKEWYIAACSIINYIEEEIIEKEEERARRRDF